MIVCHSREIGIIILLLLSCYYHMKYKGIWINWRPGETGWMDLNLVGQQSRALVAFVPPVSIKDRSLYRPWSSHRFIVPSIYLLIGVGRLVYLLSWVLALFRTDFLGWLYILG
jgi:hypothetical protein